MNSYLVIYQTDKNVASIRQGLDTMRMTEHVSDHSSIVLSFRDAEDIFDALEAYNPEKIPLVVIKLDAVIHTANIRSDFFEPNSADKL